MENPYFIDDYISYAQEITDAPIVFHKYVAYSILAAATGNNIYFEFGDLKIYPNLWVLLMAPSSLYRKSTSIGIGARTLAATGLNLILPNEFTQERLVETLSVQPQGLFVFYEFMTLATSLEKDYMVGAKAFLTELFDSPMFYTRHTKSGDFEIKDPCISILAGTTTEWFLERMKERDLYGGFLTRFIFVPCSEKNRIMSFPPAHNKEKKEALAFYLEQLNNVHSPARFSEEALAIQNSWYEINCVKEAHKHSGFIGSFINRLQIYLLKLAVLEQLARSYEDHVIVVSKEAMDSAVESVNFLKKSIELLCGEELTFDKYQEHRKKILKMIQSRKEEGISKSELLTATRMPSWQLQEVLSALIEEDKIIEEEILSDGQAGRKKTKYFIRREAV